jgi:hypothetical protein
METPARLLAKRDISTILPMSRRDADEFFGLAARSDIVKKRISKIQIPFWTPALRSTKP